jgi:hypothetical protein
MTCIIESSALQSALPVASTWRETEYRPDVCRATNGAQCLKMYGFTRFDVFPANKTILVKKFFRVFETSVSTKAEPHHTAENPKELLHENSLVRRENIEMCI